MDWLLENNPLYKNVHTASPSEFNITDIVQIIETPSHLNDPKVECTKINDTSAILRGIHQGHVRFDPISRVKNALQYLL